MGLVTTMAATASTGTPEPLYHGKAKSLYPHDEKHFRMVFRGDLTAFDAVKKATMKGKGYYNCQIAATLLPMVEKAGVPSHFVKLLSETEHLVKKVKIVKLEAPPKRSAGRKVESVQELVKLLHDEAKAI